MTKSKGFTMIETLFVLALITMGSYIIIPVHNTQLSLSSLIENRIVMNIEKTRLNAVFSHQSKSLSFDEGCIYREGECIYQNNALRFEEATIVFNENGHIQQAKTIHFSLYQKEYELIFNLGQGAYHIEEK